jgi:iron complex transport system substrate-binding protein
MAGRTRWADYPPGVERIPSIGDGLSPNVEMIVSRHPDLVVFYASPSNDAAIRQLEGVGVATVSLRTDGLADLVRATRVLGSVTGHEDTADSLISGLSKEIDSLQSDLRGSERVSVLMVAWDNPPIVIGAESFLSEIVELAGGSNVFADVERPSITTSIEAITERDPDVVLVAADSGLPPWISRPEWQSVPAVRERRLITVQGSEFNRPSFRAPAAVRRLRDALAEWGR